MRAVRLYAIKDLRVEEIASPLPPGPGEVTLALSAAGICGSDLHNFNTGAWISRAPSVAGHEFTGTVTAVGEGVAHVAPGMRVIVDSRYTCGECPACLEGLNQVCARLGFLGEAIDGGFAEAVTLPSVNVLKAPDGVPDRHLAMAEPLAVALHALDRMALPAGAPLVVSGCGPIGGLVALLASRAGHALQVIDRNTERAALVARATGGTVTTLEALAQTRFRHALDTTGAAPVITALAQAIAGAGTLGLVGIGSPRPVLDPCHLVEREVTVVGCHAFASADLARIGTLLPALSPALDDFIAEIIPLNDVPAAYARHLEGKVTGLKTIIACRDLLE